MSASERILIAVVAAGLVAMPRLAGAQQTCTPMAVAVFESVRNSVQVVQASTRGSIPASRQIQVCAGDTIRVGDNSRAVLLMLPSNTPLVIEPNSVFIITETLPESCRRAGPTSGGGSFVDLVQGALLFITRVRRVVEICTPFVNAAIEGTEFVVRVQADRTVITVFEGTVRASNDNGMVLVGPGQQAVALQNQAPQLQITVRPRDAVQWALYYEPVLPVSSLEQLAAVPEAARDAPFFVRRAGLLLAAGQLDEARSDLDQAQKLNPTYGDADALRAIVDVALNDKDGALSNGRMAVERAPQSASAQLALSYALQANLQLEAARDAAARATELEPSNAGALARLAETRLMLDDVGGAARAARDAAQRSPQVARAQVVLGFTLLAELKPSQAREAFQRAIDLESDNPLARLGMGLTRIRQGNLAEGRADLELAMALNPDNSLIRSYVGKAYFEEKREPLPAEQFEQAKQLDPQDPTPWFYDAIRKQTLNRPIEALRDLNRSIELNDNRAVYRSNLLLDEDRGARTASVARVYRDLGFEQLAFLEATMSLDADPANESSHRFLAETYGALPRHEVARVSEVLQTQLLQPTSLTPVPPRLAEADLFILQGSGPAEVGFNEFNPLFNRNRVAVRFSGVAGNRGVLGDEATVSGIWNRVSFSVGQFHYESDGFRANNQQDRDISNVFVQGQVSTRTSVQTEFRWENTRTGDLGLLFDPANYSPNQITRVDSTVARVGLRHVLNASSQVIGSFYVAGRDTTYDDEAVLRLPPIRSVFRFLTSTDSWTGEARYLFSSSRWKVTGGLGRFKSDRDRENTTDIQLPFPPFRQTSNVQFSEDERQTNGYLYSLLNLWRGSILTLGASGDAFDGGSFERKQFSPKAGLTWSPVRSTRLRVAAFKTLHRSAISNQTIEPTQVAGFNQFFNDSPGTSTSRYGVGVDQRMGNHLFGGAEYSWRDLQVFVQQGTQAQPRFELIDRREQLGRGYVYWMPQDRLSLSLEYIFERFDRDRGGAENILRLRTHRLPIALSFYSRRGWWASLKGTSIRQNGVFSNLAFATSGDDQFWVVDGNIGYRLPRRYGQLAVQIRNLFDEEFQFQDTDPSNPIVKPGRLAVMTFTLGI